MELLFIGADREVTGSCHCLHVNGKYILVDYGMEQGKDVYENARLPVKASQIDFVLVTHAHIDHSGMIPLLVRDGFTGRIICTEATARLCDLMLRDSAHIQMTEAEYQNKKAGRKGETQNVEPMYTMEDTLAALRLFEGHPYGTVIDLCEGVKIRFTDVGHLLGSSSIEVWLSENGTDRKVVFSGDIGNKNQPILRDPEYTAEADYVLCESTYGDRLHEEQTGNYVEDLVDVLRDTFNRGGNVVIPAFAVGRTQVMLYYLRRIKQENLLPEYPDFPVFVDSPMASGATEIFAETDPSYFDEETAQVLREGVNPITFRGLELTISAEESKEINVNPTPKVIISASGMCDAGRIKHHLKYNLWRSDSTIVFVGYQAEGTLGRKLIEGAEEVKVLGETIAVHAKIVQLQGMSGHADKNGLLEWVQAFEQKPRKVFVVHGDDEVAAGFADLLKEQYGLDAYAPFSGTEFDLASGEFITITKGIPVAPKSEAGGGPVSDSFTQLVLAGKRLTSLISASRGLPNKDLDRFAAELKKLMEKYVVSPAGNDEKAAAENGENPAREDRKE